MDGKAAKAMRRILAVGEPIQPTARQPTARANDKGFTLLELLVVLAVAVLILSAVPGVVGTVLPGVAFKSWTQQVASECRRLRAAAIASGQETRLQIDLNEDVILAQYDTTEGADNVAESLSVPTDVTITIRVAERNFEGVGIAHIRFFPDGSSSGGRITLSRGDKTAVISVDWLTGLVNVS